jgi:glycosyltransferase involved in cell wall biosynthesis
MSLGRIPILQFVTDFRIGGTERQVANLVAGLDESKFQLHVACFREEGQFLHEIQAHGVPIITFRIRQLDRPSTLREQWRFAAYLRRHRISLVHSYGFYPNLFAAPVARMTKARLVASIRDTGDHLSDWRRRAQRYACRLADVVLANAEAVRARLIADGYEPKRVQVIHNGIVLDRLRATRAADAVRAELGLPREAPIVTMMARFTPLKGLEHFLDAARMLVDRLGDVHFLLVGDSVCGGMGNPAYRRELEQRTARLGLEQRVHFVGFRNDTADLLAVSAVSVLPSLSEGLSNVVLEAMGAGVPVVATRVGGNPELVADAETGLLVPPRDAAALAEAVARLLENGDLARRFGSAGRRRALEQFSIEAMVDKTSRLYQGLLGLPASVASGRVPSRTGVASQHLEVLE